MKPLHHKVETFHLRVRGNEIKKRELRMSRIVAIYGSPRRKGNTSLLLKKAVQGAREVGAEVEEVVLKDLKMSPCLEISGRKEVGRCVIKDDFQLVQDQIQASRGLMLASPIFFYAVSARTKKLIDRCQSLWLRNTGSIKSLMGNGSQ